MDNNVKVWRRSLYKTRSTRRIKPRMDYAKLVLGFAILLPVIIVLITFISLAADAGEGMLMSLCFFLPVLAVAVCLIFVRANMSRFVTFIEEDGVLYRVLFANKGLAPVYLDQMIERMQHHVKSARQASCIEKVLKDACAVVNPILSVRKLRFHPRSVVAVCNVQYKAKVKRKRFRIIRDYESMDTLIHRFKELTSAPPIKSISQGQINQDL